MQLHVKIQEVVEISGALSKVLLELYNNTCDCISWFRS